MSKSYSKLTKALSLFPKIIVLVSLFLVSGKLSAQVKDSTVTGIYTSFNGYWTTTTASPSATQPDTSHNLLAFSFRGNTYSTGVNDALLNTEIGSSSYKAQVFKSLPISNIAGTVIAGNATYIALAAKNDGNASGFGYSNPFPIIHIKDVLTDGVNGLDLGTGVTNLPVGAHMSFAINSLTAESVTDSVPDLVFTQIADPTGAGADTIYFYDASNNLVGNKKLVNWNSVSKLGTYKLDLYSLATGVSCNTSTINGTVSSTPTRDIRMVAFLLTEFGITSANAASVKGVQINPNGTSDQAFIAYNTNLITINAPTITAQPQTQTFCSNATTSATFSVTATGTNTYQWKKNGTYISGATSSSYTANGLTLADTANAYSVTITNTVGSVTSSNAYVKYVIVAQPASLYVATNSSASFTVTASGATAFQWQKNAANISGATAATIYKPSVALTDAGSYTAIVTYSGGTCTSNASTLIVENLPVITAQPALQVLCNNSTTSATFSVTATSTSAISYQWYKNAALISGATASTYTASGLSYPDTASTYYVVLTNGVGSTTSSSAGLKYLILSQPSGSYVATGTPVTFSVTTSAVATGYQWYKGATAISGATSRTYSISSPSLSDIGYYSVAVSYSGGSCTSNNALLRVENLPVITTQPQQKVLCNSSATSATFSVTATSISSLSYQWYKNGFAIPGATSGNYTVNGLTLADTANSYSVVLTNGAGSTTSNSAGVKYLIFTQPVPSSAYLATGNTITFAATLSSVATLQWQKNGSDISGATSLSYKIDTVITPSAGNYTLKISTAGGYCITSADTLTTSTILYSKATGDVNDVSTWGVMPDGSGSSPVDFTRPEHTFIISNRVVSTNTSNLTIAGTYDLGDTITTISPGTTLEAGQIIRSHTNGKIAGTATSGLIVHGKSDIYFDANNKVLQTLTINTTDTVTLHTALDITAGSGHGIVKVMAGVFNTGDSLTLKSDANGTASVGNSAGRITGKVTVERFIPAHRSWRLFSSPVSDSLAPTIHDAWQEGAVSSTDNPHPGYGTHITYGNVSDGFDQNPQHTFSMKVQNAGGQWIGVPATNTTRVTDYPAYFLFIRGDRSYDITNTTNKTTPQPTIIRTTGYLRQHTQPNAPVAATGYTLVANPYASPVDFESVYNRSSNIAQHVWMWNPTLVGDKGTGAYILVYWNGSSYNTAPALTGANNLRFLQAYEGFYVESNGAGSSLSLDEGDKDTASIITPFGKETVPDMSALEINLNVFNADSTTSAADGMAYLFSKSFNNGIDKDDITKLPNTSENSGILSNGKLLAVEQRELPADKDSLQLSLTHTKSAKYELEIIPNKISNISWYLYDRYLNSKTPVSTTDTSRITIDINTSVDSSKAANRFVIVSKTIVPVSVMFTHISAAAKNETIQIDWSTINEANVLYYKIERSADGSNFIDIGETVASGKTAYNFIDSKPLQGINYYRIQSVNRTGAPSYTGVVSEIFNSDVKSNVVVYPNPLTSNHCLIELHNKPAGKYELRLINSIGQNVFTTTLNVTEGNSTQPVTLPASLASGNYQVQINGGDKKEISKLTIMY